MIRSDKKINELSATLKTNNNISISNAIETLRDEQPYEGAIGLLTSFYNEADDFAIRKIIEGFMNDQKDQAVAAEVITEIKKQWNPSTVSMLVSSCWQSGLDYSEYSADLARVFINSDYITALECLTVIEETAHELSTEKKSEIINIIRENIPSKINEKYSLFQELITMLSR